MSSLYHPVPRCTARLPYEALVGDFVSFPLFWRKYVLFQSGRFRGILYDVNSSLRRCGASAMKWPLDDNPWRRNLRYLSADKTANSGIPVVPY